MSSQRNTHWCYQCSRPVQLQSGNLVCPYCDGGFVQELNEVRSNNFRDVEELSQHFRTLEEIEILRIDLWNLFQVLDLKLWMHLMLL
ncbi:unnamed protein product [Coffea canephora]|uniref:RING-type E3 ubiquitin transferase n=1 Tax=Coffea canephora TaxID=49390 RepID=A0A068UMH2_COFCA|nr:unnamed protein product [Coffea canephora]